MWTTAQRAEEALYVRRDVIEEPKQLSTAAFALQVSLVALIAFGLGLAGVAALGL